MDAPDKPGHDGLEREPPLRYTLSIVIARFIRAIHVAVS
jgi:hypothetical protein